MSKDKYSKARETYLMCMQDILYNCTKKIRFISKKVDFEEKRTNRV